MVIAQKPGNEAERLAVLRSYGLLDTPPEKDFDEIVALASALCETSISSITLVDENRQWFKAKVGNLGTETSRDASFCAHVILDEQVMIVPDATKDARFFDNPLVLADPDIRFYAGMPLINPSGYKLGTLCVIDTQPKTLTPSQIFGLQVLSKQVVKQMELKRKVEELNELNDTNSKLLSIIGHDLRSPLASLYGVLELSDKYGMTAEEFQSTIPKLKSSFTAANQLLSNLLEWATAQFNQTTIASKSIYLEGVVDDIIKSNSITIHLKRNVLSNLIKSSTVAYVDENMFRCIVRNLLLNANKFTQDGLIAISAQEYNSYIEVCVADTGIGMDQERVNRIFEWDKRASTNGTQGEKGSGLGLLVCKDFVEKNGGTMRIQSTQGKGSSFYFTLPKHPVA